MQLKVERFHVYIEVHKYNSYLNGWRPYIQLFILTTTFFYKLQTTLQFTHSLDIIRTYTPHSTHTNYSQ